MLQEEIAPPSYSDLEKNIRDVFGKCFNFRFFEFYYKKKSPTGVEGAFREVCNFDTRQISVSLEVKRKFEVKGYGVTYMEKWSTITDFIKLQNQLKLPAEISVTTDVFQGAKVSFVPILDFHTDDYSLLVKSEYKNQLVSLDFDIDVFNSGTPRPSRLIKGSGVCGYNGWLAGASFNFDLSKSELKHNSFSLCYVANEFAVHTILNDCIDFAASVYLKVSPKLDLACRLCSDGGTKPCVEVGLKYYLDDSSLRLRANGDGQVGLSYRQKVCDFVTLTYSALFHDAHLKEGRYTLGFGVELLEY